MKRIRSVGEAGAYRFCCSDSTSGKALLLLLLQQLLLLLSSCSLSSPSSSAASLLLVLLVPLVTPATLAASPTALTPGSGAAARPGSLHHAQRR